MSVVNRGWWSDDLAEAPRCQCNVFSAPSVPDVGRSEPFLTSLWYDMVDRCNLRMYASVGQALMNS